MKIKIGNTTREISNNMSAQLQVDSIDPEYLYAEIYGTLPVYRCEYNLNGNIDENNGECYDKVFDDLLASGKFNVLVYQYSNSNRENRWDKGEPTENLHAEKYLLAGIDEPVEVLYNYDMLFIFSHLGRTKIDEIVNEYMKPYMKTNNDVKCYIIMRDHGNYLGDFPIKLDNDLDFDLYNTGFEDIHKDIVKSIKEDNNGLYLLYGKPGTGKTTYIRHLIKECGTEERKFIYVPSNLFGDFTNPSFLPFLIENKGCVFIIEDCESLVTTIDGVRSDVITDLLNMTDGLLADALNIKIICTFNIDDGEIDDALLRPGRCRCKYEFNLLDKNRANKVAEKLGLNKVNKDVSLADLFNSGKSYMDEKKKKIGFAPTA